MTAPAEKSGCRAPALTLPRKRGREGWGCRSASWAIGIKRVSAAALITLPIAACGATPPSAPAPPALRPAPPPPGPLAPRAQLRAGFGNLVNTIEIGAVERLPLREAILVAPDGTIVPASYINVADNPGVATGQWSLSQRWDDPVSRETALGALTWPGLQAGGALYARQQLLATVSAAEIPVPDPVAYRRDWRNLRIRLTFGTPPGEVVTTEIPAPEPPPR